MPTGDFRPPEGWWWSDALGWMPPATNQPDVPPLTDVGARQLLSELERELGVKGTTAVFRKALALARAARADVARPEGKDA